MSYKLDRRSLMKASALGLGTVAVPTRSAVLTRGFTHGVASGEPRSDSVLLWTRFVPPSGSDAKLVVEIAESEDFGRVVGRTEAAASPASDHCAKATLDGLQPARWYYYRFTAPDGNRSVIGRTRTLPQGETDRFRIAAFSCANLPFGYFNAYAHAAARDDIDLVLHLGDYIYEYGVGTYPSTKQMLPGRLMEPATEIVRLADYHARYASYRADPDLAELHRRFPMIAIWDDHEITNDAYKDGAQNHQPEEGDWETRKRAAKTAYRNWMPVSDKPYDRYEIGNLITLMRLDTRIEGRDKQLDLGEVLKGAADRQAALVAFRDGPWSNPARTMLGTAQEQWLADALAGSVKAGTRWQLVAQQVLVGNLVMPQSAKDWVGVDAPDYVRDRFAAGLAAAAVGLPQNLDSWGGYPAARARLLQSAQAAGANLVILAGDTHNAWAFELAHDGKPAGIEFGVQGVTSPGIESYVRDVAPARVATELADSNPELKWCDTSRRGYMTVDFSPDDVRTDWLFVDGIRERSTRITGTHKAQSRHGSAKLTLA